MDYFRSKCYKIQIIHCCQSWIPLHGWPLLISMPPKLQPSWKILPTLSILHKLEARVGPNPQYLINFVDWKLKSFLNVDHYFLVNAFSRIILSNFIEIKWKRNSGKGFFRMDVNSMWPCAPDILDKVNGIAWAFKDPDFQLVSRCHRMYLWIKHFLLNDGPYLLT